jgi:leucyl-tRNA---protein transferase
MESATQNTAPLYVEHVIDQSIALCALPPQVFDLYLERGWRMLGHQIIRHNISVYEGRMCHTIPLRIRLDGFAMSKSQRKLLRRNKVHFSMRCREISLNAEKELLFQRHTTRFRDLNNYEPYRLDNFLSCYAHYLPVPGYEIELYDGSRLVACSYFHVGANAISGTYCFFEPDYHKDSLGVYTLLLELEIAQRLGKVYYYHGYCYDIPSQFDYKLNYNNLEAMNWESGAWSEIARGKRI